MWSNGRDLFTYDWINVETFCVALFGLWFAYGVVAWWLGGRPWSWFAKFVFATLGVASMFVGGAYDLLQMLWSFGVTIAFGRVLAGAVLKWRGRRRALKHESQTGSDVSLVPGDGVRTQWSIKGLLYAVTALAVSIFVCTITSGEEEVVPAFFTIGFGVTAGCVLLASAAIGKHASRIWLVLAMVVAAGGQWLAFRLIFQPPTFSSLFEAMEGTGFIWGEIEDFAMGVLLTIAFSFLLFGCLCRWMDARGGATPIFGRISQVFVGAVVLMQFVLIGDLFYKVSGDEPVRLNRFQAEAEFMLEQAVLIENTELEYWNYFPRDETKRMVLAAAEPLGRVEQILDSVELVDAEVTYVQQPEFDLWDLSKTNQKYRSIARALGFRSEWARSQGDHDAALKDGVLIAKLPTVFVDERTIASRLYAIAVEGIGAYRIAPNIDGASEQALSQALTEMLRIEESEVDAEIDYQNDWELWWHSLDWLGRLYNLCGQTEHHNGFQNNTLNAVKRCQVTRRQLIVMLALELYQRKYQGLPTELMTLTPEFLPAVPLDPFDKSGMPPALIYRRAGNSYLLYSLGFDGRDDGGVNYEFGYGGPSECEGIDLNFPAGVKQSLIEEQDDRKAALEGPDDDEWEFEEDE